MSQKYDVVILGSGISALTCALLLLKKGKSVVVLEQYNKAGGYMHSFRRFGELFDTGAHYMGALGPGQPFHTLLKYLNVHKDDLFVPLNPKGFDIFHFPEGRIQIPMGYEEVIKEVSATFPNEKSAIRSYFELIAKTVHYFPTYEFSETPEMEMPAEVLETSLKAIVTKLTSNPRLQSVFYAYCGLHGVRPDEVSFGLHALVTDSLIRGPYGLTRGGDALTAEYVREIQALGGKVLTRKKVISLKTSGHMVTVVETESGEAFCGEWIISSIHPKVTFRLLDSREMLTPVFQERITNMKESTGIFGLYGITSQQPPFDPLSNAYFFSSSDPQSLFKNPTQTEGPRAVFMSTSKRHWSENEKSYPMSFHAETPAEWFAAWKNETYGRRSLDYINLKTQITDQMLNLVNQYKPGFSLMMEKSVTSTPLTNEFFNGSEDGSPYGIYHSIQNTGARALGPRTKVRNLLLTGQSCLFPGLLGAAISALRTSGHIVGIKSLISELQQVRNLE